MSEKVRLALPSKGRLKEDTLALLQACDMKVSQYNSRQYIGHIATMPQIEVWFQHVPDIVRQVRDGVVDLGIAGTDLVQEHRGDNGNVLFIHDELNYGHCTLEVIVPEAWNDINSMRDQAQLTEKLRSPAPLRIASKFKKLTMAFLAAHQVTPVRYLQTDGAIEAAPNMGTADFIVDLVSSGATIRENRLKTLQDGRILQSQACFIGNQHALIRKKAVLDTTYQILEWLEAHFRAEQFCNVIVNMRGDRAKDVAARLHSQSELRGLRGPTIAPVYSHNDNDNSWFAASLVVRKSRLQTVIQQLREIGGSGVVVLPANFIFEEEPERWQTLCETLGI